MKALEENTEWKTLTLENLCTDKGLVRGPFGGSLKKAFFVNEGYKVYEQKNAIYRDVSLGNYFIDEKKFNELRRFEVKEADFIVSCSGTIGRIFRIPPNAPKGVINQALLKIEIDKTKIDSEYFYQYFGWESFQKKIIDNTQGGAMQNLVGMAEFRKTKLSIPSLKEQKKIATILLTWDKAIELKEMQIEQKKVLKKGLMKKLLTGEVRLPGFEQSWKWYSIEELAEYFTDGDWIEAPYITDEGVLLIQTGNIGIGKYIEKSNLKFISEKSFIELKCTEVKPGDVLICRLADPIGRSCIVPDTRRKMITAVDVAIMRVDNKIANTSFINYLLNLPKTLRKMDSLGAGSTRKRISRKNLGKVKLRIPSLEEQKAIANILSQIDDNIHLLEKELNELKKQKKGLMQLLLTGKVRVQV